MKGMTQFRSFKVLVSDEELKKVINIVFFKLEVPRHHSGRFFDDLQPLPNDFPKHVWQKEILGPKVAKFSITKSQASS
jgi:hypothetical protein